MDATMRIAERAGDEAAVAVARARRGELVEGAVVVLDAALGSTRRNGFTVPAPKFWTGTWQVLCVHAGKLTLRRVRADGKATLPASRTNSLWIREAELRACLTGMGVPLALEDPADVAIRSIEAAELPAFVANVREESRREWAKRVRVLLKTLGVVGVSVTVPSHSMAQAIDIEFDALRHKCTDTPRDRCEACSRVRRADRRLEALILSAYPDLNNRSDSTVDHFDYCLSVRAK